jgi:hypothetical protein
MVVRDPSSNARWTVDAVLAANRVVAADPLVEAATPRAALSEARRRGAPVLLSRHVLAGSDFVVLQVEGLAFPRTFAVVTAAYRGPTAEVRELIQQIRDYARIWLR